MAISELSSPESPQQTKLKLAAEYRLLLQKAERQRTLANEMGKRAKKMSDDAVKMRERALFFVLP